VRYQVECYLGVSRVIAWVPREDCVRGRTIDAPVPRLYDQDGRRFLKIESERMVVLHAYPNCGVEEVKSKS
jgi:hypothetical protein